MVIDNSKQHYTIGMANGDVRNYPHGSGNIRMTTRAELDKLQAVEHVDYREPVVGTFADHEQPTSTLHPGRQEAQARRGAQAAQQWQAPNPSLDSRP